MVYNRCGHSHFVSLTHHAEFVFLQEDSSESAPFVFVWTACLCVLFGASASIPLSVAKRLPVLNAAELLPSSNRVKPLTAPFAFWGVDGFEHLLCESVYYFIHSIHS